MGSSLRVMVVDDDDLVRRITARLLARAGHEVVQVGSGEAAIALYDQGAKIDLLLTDGRMPGLSGRQVAQVLQSRDPSLRVLFTSGYAADPTLGLQPGDAFIAKPFTGDQLAQAIAELFSTPGHQ